MVNIEEFTKRLNQVMEYYDLSAASFADKIEVGRSSISHLLSGRNKPSLDFVMKIVKAFPEVELYWLLNGKGNFPKKNESRLPHLLLSPQNPTLFHRIFFLKKKSLNRIFSNSSGKKIKKIVIFYTDGSFDAYQN